jgi:phosphoglycerate dehydrogenase-like enzyme
MLRGLFILDASALKMVYGPEQRHAIERHVRFTALPQTRHTIKTRPELLADVDVIFSGWGSPIADSDFLDAAPNLKTIFYAAGAIGSWVTQELWDRGITVTSASIANAVPVAEYTLSTILFSLKHGWALARQTREQRLFPPRDGAPGAYKSTVGLASMGVIARTLLPMLKMFDFKVLAYDPFLSYAEAMKLGIEKMSLEDLFLRSDVVSIHTPSLAETRGMVTGDHIASMKPGATFINTSRGELVCEDEMIRVLAKRPDLQAVLDVTIVEPPERDSLLYTLPNVVMTPHIAGSVGNECRRLGQYMVDELERYVAGEPLKWIVTPDAAKNSTHRPEVTVKVVRRLVKSIAAVGNLNVNH